ncbi:hypothetical protein [Actinomyces sp. HMSC065F12]|uniref:hypothetical protein n=1 Tax=Actinomyces sp. HMSC065F12 TaxID=1739479 RepID=UPI001878FC6D|nr:hypothetical protein [Actinomyces sp. HMSC065F12]
MTMIEDTIRDSVHRLVSDGEFGTLLMNAAATFERTENITFEMGVVRALGVVIDELNDLLDTARRLDEQNVGELV